MAKSRTLIQDIADSLGLSRATVSKVLNDSGKVSPQTRERVLKKAAEMDYRQLSLFTDITGVHAARPLPADAGRKTASQNIAFLVHRLPDKQHMAFQLLSIMEQSLREKGYALTLYTVTEQDILQRKLPHTLHTEHIDALVCAEMFDKDYTKILCALGKPMLLIDSYYNALSDSLAADILTTENIHSVSHMVQRIVREHKLTEVGFVGAYMHCLSFYERWYGFCLGLQSCGLELNRSQCIISQQDSVYWNQKWFIAQLKRLEPFPELFVCANDALAHYLITCLKELNINVPRNVLVAGYDNISLSSLSAPSLTTIDSGSSLLGAAAAQQILVRIENPSSPYVKICLPAQIVFRESTKRTSKNHI